MKEQFKDFSFKVLALSLTSLLLLIFSGIHFLFNSQKNKIVSNRSNVNAVDVDFNNVFSSQKNIQITEKAESNGFKYCFYEKNNGKNLFDLSLNDKLRLDDMSSAPNGLNATLVSAGMAIAAGGPAGVPAAIGAIAKTGQLIRGAAWLVRGSAGAVTTLKLAGAAAITASPIGTALAAVGTA